MHYLHNTPPSLRFQAQVGTVDTIPVGEDFEVVDTTGANIFFFINCPEEVTLEVVTWDMNHSIRFRFDPGWNPVKIRRIVNNTVSNLFFGI